MIKDIQNMEYSLRTMENFVRLISGMDNKTYLPNVLFWCDYPFLDIRNYFYAVNKWKYSNNPSDKLKKTLHGHWDSARFLVDALDSMEREKSGAKLQCYYRCLAYSTDEVYWFFLFDTNYYCRMLAPMKWECGKTSVLASEAMDLLGIADVNCGYSPFLAEELFQIVSKIFEKLKSLLGDVSEETQPTKATLTIPEDILKKLAETKCSNEKPFIEIANTKSLIWLQSKQLARELLTHNKIKGNLSDTEIGKQATKLFIYKDKPLQLAKNKHIQSRDSDLLMEILATL